MTGSVSKGLAEAERIPASVFAGKPATFLEKVYQEGVTLILTWYGKDRAKVVPVERSVADRKPKRSQ